MKKFIKTLCLISFSLITHNYFSKNLIFNQEIVTLIKVAAVLTIFELILKPILKIILLPINLLTLGLFRVIINVLGLYLAVYLIGDFQVSNINVFGYDFTYFMAYLVTSFIISIILYFYISIFKKEKS